MPSGQIGSVDSGAAEASSDLPQTFILIGVQSSTLFDLHAHAMLAGQSRAPAPKVRIGCPLVLNSSVVHLLTYIGITEQLYFFKRFCTTF